MSMVSRASCRRRSLRSRLLSEEEATPPLPVLPPGRCWKSMVRALGLYQTGRETSDPADCVVIYNGRPCRPVSRAPPRGPGLAPRAGQHHNACLGAAQAQWPRRRFRDGTVGLFWRERGRRPGGRGPRSAFWVLAAPCATTRRSCRRCPGSRPNWRPSWACEAPRKAVC